MAESWDWPRPSLASPSSNRFKGRSSLGVNKWVNLHPLIDFDYKKSQFYCALTDVYFLLAVK
jgi:hypothetical protein